MRLYIESTIPSLLVARPARAIKEAARQQTTQDWWEYRRHLHELFISQVVVDEVSNGEAAMAERRLAAIRQLPVLAMTNEAQEFTAQIAATRILPASVERDIAHIAIATMKWIYYSHGTADI